jgi:hypothetical protein
MIAKNQCKILNRLFLFICCAFLVSIITSCGKQSGASSAGLNIQYEILNLSPDLGPVNLFIDFKQVNTFGNPFVFNQSRGYFYVPSIDIPYQIRSAFVSGTELFSRNDSLRSGLKYSLFITGSYLNGAGTLVSIFTVDSASAPTTGRGKLRFVDASPSGIGGLDVYANDTLAFSKVTYPNYSKYIELPVGNYDLKIRGTGSTGILNEQPSVTIQDGRLYTLYAYGYTTRTDTAAFNAAIITNR